MTDSSSPPALALMLKRGAKQAAGQEIVDAATGEVVAIIPEGKFAGITEALVLASPGLLYANMRASAHLCQSTDRTSEERRLCRLLRDAFRLATHLPSK